MYAQRMRSLLIAQQRRLRTDTPGGVVKINFGDHIFMEHMADVGALLECGGRYPCCCRRGWHAWWPSTQWQSRSPVSSRGPGSAGAGGHTAQAELYLPEPHALSTR